MHDSSQPTAELCINDERMIRKVLLAYATGIDQRDWALFQSCFTADCVADYGSFGTWNGADEITAYMKEAHASLGKTLHRITNIVIWPNADGAQARCYVDALLCPQKADQPVHRGIGLYEDQLVRSGNGWQIERRQFHEILVD